jgi:glutaredoxin
MTAELRLYTRKDCCLCKEMKAALSEVAARVPFTLEEIDIDTSAELRKQFGDEVPVLFINGRKAFKYRLTTAELERGLNELRDD